MVEICFDGRFSFEVSFAFAISDMIPKTIGFDKACSFMLFEFKQFEGKINY